MRKLNIEVLEDSGRPGGGHAVIRLLGLESLPDNITYRIKPVDGGSTSEASGAWLDGERIPLAARVTALGAELVVGPEVVENPMFLPGTLAVIEIARCGVRGEFLWPRIAPLSRPKRRHLLGTRAQREPAGDVLAADARTSEVPTGEILFAEATDASSNVMPMPVATSQPMSSAPGEPIIGEKLAPASMPPSPIEPVVPQVATVGGGRAAGGPALAEPTLPKATAAGRARAEAQIGWQGASRRSRRSSMGRIAAVIGLALAGFGAFTHFLPARSRTSAIVTAGQGPERSPISSLIAAGSVSPNGTDAERSPPQKLLEEADANLHASNGDKREAAFLLRRYLSGALGDERTLWALTQLGSLHADPPAGESADYVKARQLWELASSLGDGVAMCFLASLYEHGLGVQADRGLALQWLMRAKAAGGCRDVDAAIDRLQSRKRSS